jgi:ABC-type antimicrobial peptide transport system permease subunit
VIVAILGIINTLTVSIIDRKRELGVLRAVGGFRRQIRQTVWMEAVAIGLVGLALGLLFGAANLYFLLQITGRDLSGMYLPYRFPFQHRADAASDDSCGRFLFGPLACRISRPDVARGGAGV